MRYCIICGNQIDADASLCPACGASQETELPRYGGGGKQNALQPIQHDRLPSTDEDGKPDYTPGVLYGSMQPQFGMPLYQQQRLEQEHDQKKKREKHGTKKDRGPVAVPDENISRKKSRLLITLVAAAAGILLVSVYFLILVLTRNSFLSDTEKLGAGIPAFGYTINGNNYGELKLVEMKKKQTEGLFTFEALYDVTMADDRLEHRLTMEVKGENTFPFGWKVTSVEWSEKTQGMVTVNITGLRALVQEEVEKGIPSHKVENFAIWVKNPGDSNAFEGDCVIANQRGACYTIQGAYCYSGTLTPSMFFYRGSRDYVLTISQRKEDTFSVSYGVDAAQVREPVFILNTLDEEVRLQISQVSGTKVQVDAFRILKDGSRSGSSTVRATGDAYLSWNVEYDPLTENPLAAERVGGTTYLFDPSHEFEIILAPDFVEVICDGQLMQEERGVPLEPEGWTDPTEELDGLETTEA